MNKNVENYKKAVDQIHVDEGLKSKVLEQIKEKNKKKTSIYYFRYVISIAAVIIVAVIGVKINFDSNKLDKKSLDMDTESQKNIEEELLAKANIKRFKNSEELREFLKEHINEENFYFNNATVNSLDDTVASAETANSSSSKELDLSSRTDMGYSKTNNQVENVDEADIVKTDGKYIYYCQNSKVYILDNDLNLKSEIEDEDNSPTQIFINGNKLIVIEYNYYTGLFVVDEAINGTATKDIAKIRVKTIVKVYNLDDIENPKLEREIYVDGNYNEARMIEDNIYFVTTCGINFYEDLNELEDAEILPCYKDSAISDEYITVDANKIAYFDNNGNDYIYSIVAGFNLNSNEAVNIETFLGNRGEIYVSENNMYIVSPNYNENFWYSEDSTIYKFILKDGTATAAGTAVVQGQVDNQFSIDEYDGNLRIATTVYEYNDIENWNNFRAIRTSDYKYKTRLTIFDENLEKIGEIKNLIEDEEIYAVRFIEKIGYIVTFEEVDPLWVIDLSDPTNPVIKGELEIPGYSSYLHPWDENHIIGIGYNVEDNGYGGVTNDTLKMSMFDVSDLENPKEIFKVDIGKSNSYSYSDVISDHKALFINKSKDLIGFPIYTYSRYNSNQGLILYKVDLKNSKFEKISDLIENNDGYLKRGIYIGEYLYELFDDRIEKFDINTFENVKEILLDTFVEKVMEE